jgi:hypothetical protein
VRARFSMKRLMFLVAILCVVATCLRPGRVPWVGTARIHVAITLVDSISGQPIADATVLLTHPKLGAYYGTTDRSGTVEFDARFRTDGWSQYPYSNFRVNFRLWEIRARLSDEEAVYDELSSYLGEFRKLDVARVLKLTIRPHRRTANN